MDDHAASASPLPTSSTHAITASDESSAAPLGRVVTVASSVWASCTSVSRAGDADASWVVVPRSSIKVLAAIATTTAAAAASTANTRLEVRRKAGGTSANADSCSRWTGSGDASAPSTGWSGTSTRRTGSR